MKIKSLSFLLPLIFTSAQASTLTFDFWEACKGCWSIIQQDLSQKQYPFSQTPPLVQPVFLDSSSVEDDEDEEEFELIAQKPSEDLRIPRETLTLPIISDHDARGQTLIHPQFGPIYYIKIFPVSNFVKDSYENRNQWIPGSRYYRDTVLAQEEINIQKAYQAHDELYARNHPDIACKYSALMDKKGPKIPLITHSIWLTNLNAPVELKEHFVEWFKKSCALHSSSVGWKHYFWVQDRTKLPKTISELEGSGIEVKEVYKELCNEADFCGLRRPFETEISELKFGRAADILRGILLHRYGGIYRDIDFLMTRPFTGLAMGYDFFVGIEHAYSYPSNAIMGFRPGHPVLKKLLKIIARNYNKETAPAYIQDCLNVGDKGRLLQTLCLTGPIALGVALNKVLLSPKRESKDCDIVMPPEVFFNDGYKECSMGTHAFAATWLSKECGSRG